MPGTTTAEKKAEAGRKGGEARARQLKAEKAAEANGTETRTRRRSLGRLKVGTIYRQIEATIGRLGSEQMAVLHALGSGDRSFVGLCEAANVNTAGQMNAMRRTLAGLARSGFIEGFKGEGGTPFYRLTGEGRGHAGWIGHLAEAAAKAEGDSS